VSLSIEISQLFESETWSLPTSWCWEHISAVADVVGGGTPKTTILSNFGSDVAWITPADMSRHNNIYISSGARSLSISGYENSGAQKMPKGSVLFSSRAPIGYVAIAAVELTTNQGFKSFSPRAGVNSKYIYYWLIFSKHFAEKLASGTTFLEVSGKNAGLIPFPVAPRNEQTRIVEKLEELLSDLDNGVDELKAAQTKLNQYRQSLLKSAVEGSLTAEWRQQNPVTETGEQLLQRILTERRQRWEQQKLAEFKEKGKTPPKDWQKKYPEPVQPDTSELPELPNGWVWASLDMLGDIVSGVTKGTKRKNPVEVFETSYLRVANVQRGYLDLSEIKTIPATKSDIEKYTLQKGDILFNEGGDRDKLGRGWVWYGEVENCIHQNHVFRLRPYLAEVIPELISHYGNTFGKIWFQNAGKQTTNLASINKGILQSFPVPLSPYAEQTETMSLLTTEIDKVDRQIIAVDVSLKETDAQRKNILKDAFSGKLAPQNPSDEPASVLLEKIKAERVAQAKLPKPKRAKKKPNTMKNFDLDALKKWVADTDNDYFTFTDIEAGVSADYENLKNIIFLALSEPRPVIYQYFDEAAEKMVFKKASA
jgi:type I restriction enzyme S subunit